MQILTRAEPANAQLSGEDAGTQNVTHILCGGARSEPAQSATSTACYTSPFIRTSHMYFNAPKQSSMLEIKETDAT